MFQHASWTVFLVGCCGGLVGEVFKWYQLRESRNFPAYAGSPFYWLVTVAMIACGGLLALAYNIEKPTALLIGNIGLSAPLIIKSLAASAPKARTRGLAPVPNPRPNLREFLSAR